MPTVYRLNYQPDINANWASNPGICTAMGGMAQLQNGNLAPVSRTANAIFTSATTGTDVLHAQMFTQVNNSVRLLAFRKQNIDEYSSSGTRTNRGTGYNAATEDWSAAAWGNQVIACNYRDATQSSTGAGFSGLGGGSPKARSVAANVHFVMLADVDDGGSNVYADMVWWSAIRNPSSWTPSLATQAGNVRLLDTPGPIKNVVSYRDKFIAFKENAIFIGEYVGPPYVFSWRVISSSIGLSHPKGVTECDGKLYFWHHSGFYEFDGQQIKNVSVGVANEIAAVASCFSLSVSPMRCVADEKEGIVWLVAYFFWESPNQYDMYPFGYNIRTGLWSCVGLAGRSYSSDAGGAPQAVVFATSAQRNLFDGFSYGGQDGFNYFNNGASPRYYKFDYGGSDVAPTLTTGYVGQNDVVPYVIRAYPRFVSSNGGASVSSSSVSGYKIENGTTTGSATMNWNTETGTLDGILSAKYYKLSITFAAVSAFELSGIGFDFVAGARR